MHEGTRRTYAHTGRIDDFISRQRGKGVEIGQWTYPMRQHIGDVAIYNYTAEATVQRGGRGSTISTGFLTGVTRRPPGNNAYRFDENTPRVIDLRGFRIHIEG